MATFYNDPKTAVEKAIFSAVKTMASQFTLFPVDSLKLDPLNPRLPESLQGKSQSEI